MSDRGCEFTKNTCCPHCGRDVVLAHCNRGQKNIELYARGNRPIGAQSAAAALAKVITRYSNGEELSYNIDVYMCPNTKCSRTTVIQTFENGHEEILYPESINRGVDLQHVEPSLIKDYLEAVAVLPRSTNASAALSRRTLQSMLKLNGAKKKWLKDQIEELEDSFPASLSLYIDQIRELGNLAAHASREIGSAEIVDVNPEEAEWMLYLIEGLFDHFYTKPKQNEERLAAVRAKINSTKTNPPVGA